MNNENAATIREEEVKKRSQSIIRRIVILGAGGVGYWTTVALSRARLGQQIVVWDADDFNGGNGRERLPAVDNPDTKKVRHLQNFISFVMGESDIIAHTSYANTEFAWFFEPTDLVVDCTDMPLGERRKLWEAIESKGARMLRISYDGNGIVVVSSGLPFGPDTAAGGYDRIPSFAQSLRAGGTGAEVILKILQGIEMPDLSAEV